MRPLSLGPIRYPRMADQIAATIRDSIASGQLPSGMHLREVEIAREMQTSRVPVREALMQLEQEGMVVRRPNRGTFVAELNEKDLREVSVLRGLLEGFAAGQAANQMTRADFVNLERLIREMRLAAHERDYPRLLRCDYEFHECIVRAAGNDLLVEVWRKTQGKVLTYLSATNLVYSNWKSLAVSHAALLDALRTADPERAREAMATHIERPLHLIIPGAPSARKNRIVTPPLDEGKATAGRREKP